MKANVKTQNAASNLNFWERWHFNLGFLRLYQVKESKFQVRLFPSSIYGIITAGSQAKLNLTSTLQTGIIIYEKDGLVSLLELPAAGIGVISSIAIDKNFKGGQFYYDLMAHETMHILQYDNMVWLNPFFNKLDNKWKSKSKFYRSASKYIYFDINGLTIYELYMTQINKAWNCRFIEIEAELFSQKESLSKCH